MLYFISDNLEAAKKIDIFICLRMYSHFESFYRGKIQFFLQIKSSFSIFHWFNGFRNLVLNLSPPVDEKLTAYSIRLSFYYPVKDGMVVFFVLNESGASLHVF